MHCLWCEMEIIPTVHWGNLVQASRPSFLCEECTKKLERIKGRRCTKCSRKTSERICQDCQWWGSQQEDPLSTNHSVYAYNEFMQEVIAKWKYRGDYVLKDIFAEAFIQTFIKVFGKQKDAQLIPIPLSNARLKERGFNQAEALANSLPNPSLNLLSRTGEEKQSKKSRKERVTGKNPFVIKETLNKPAILVDDIYTTGTTLRHAADLLRQNGCPEVNAFTLIRG
ncbi:ComF family protein [Oceanobacillus kapialis]|uniref:ComF family protein n=1 Tax=Oceanobacillus kapialis TaxID=481353 RepID=UPI003850C180